LTVHVGRLEDALAPEMLATDLAEYLVRKGVPFRETHHVAGAAVRMAEDRGCPLSELTLSDLQTLHPAFDDDVHEVWSFEASAERRDAEGGSSRRATQTQIENLRAWLDEPPVRGQ
jgi:argininosuccinate lyase